MSNVKSYEYVRKYFNEANILVAAIKKYNEISKVPTKVYNIKAYLLAALFNAGATMSNYYRAEVNHDMPQFAG